MKKALILCLFFCFTISAGFSREPVAAYKDKFKSFGLGAEAGYWDAPSVALTLSNRFAQNWHFTVGVAGMFDADFTESEYTQVERSRVQPQWSDRGEQNTSHYAEVFVKLGRKIYGKIGFEAGFGYSFQSRGHVYYSEATDRWFATGPNTRYVWTGMAMLTYDLSDTLMLSVGGHSKRGVVAGITLYTF